VIDRQRYPIILRQICRLLAIPEAEEVESKTFVRVADGRRLRPPIRPERGNRHDPVLVQERQNLRSDLCIYVSPPRWNHPSVCKLRIIDAPSAVEILALSANRLSRLHFADSPLEGTEFEPSVPLDGHLREVRAADLATD